MSGRLPGHQFPNGMETDGLFSIFQNMPDGSQSFRSNWYLNRGEIEDHSPSRKDGIDLKKETQLRKLYCSFLQDLGLKLRVPHETIATAMVFCHRFYLRQSHAKNDWQTIATVSMFLAGKVEETPRPLANVIVAAYEMIYRRDLVAAQQIKRKEVYEKQKELILIGERLLLCTIGFDMNIQHPYRPLTAACKKLKIAQKMWKTAWTYVNNWLQTTLCLQYKPHYIAAGSMFLAAKFHQVKLPSERGMVWWQEFDVTPRQLEEVIQQMTKLLDQNRRAEVPCASDKATQTTVAPEKAASTSPHSCVLSGSPMTCESSHAHDKEIGVVTSAASTNPDISSSSVLADDFVHPVREGEVQNPSSLLVSEQCQMSDCGSMHSVVEDAERFDEVTNGRSRPSESDQKLGNEVISVHLCLSEMDKERFKAKLKRRRWERSTKKTETAMVINIDDYDAWIERELENGIEAKEEPLGKKTRWVGVLK